MSIYRNSSTYFTGGGAGSTTYTKVGYDPAYAGTEKGRIIFVAHRSAAAVAGAIRSITYGGVPMRLASGHPIGNFNTSVGIFYIINPPTGAQNIVFTTVGAVNWSMQVGVVSYYSDTDFSFRIGQIKTGISSGTTTGLATTFNTVNDSSWSIAMSSINLNQTINLGTYVTGNGNPSNFEVVDSNGEIPDATSTGIDVSYSSTSGICYQEVATFLPIRRGIFDFFNNI
jgi:hypothetical protein